MHAAAGGGDNSLLTNNFRFIDSPFLRLLAWTGKVSVRLSPVGGERESCVQPGEGGALPEIMYGL